MHGPKPQKPRPIFIDRTEKFVVVCMCVIVLLVTIIVLMI
jgi:hypothetical protein